mmetsp:Transcript_467/g.688  ORF Transcript_467/g.688 Transcript_467/m.688 type:complete len:444 (-) Transcript_467:1809-3140(-)
MDIAETPKLKRLEINGRLSIKSDAANLPKMKLQSFLIWVRAGSLLVGSKDTPFEQEFTLELLGETESDTLTLDGTTKAGNKVLATNGKVEMHGKKRTNMSRLIESAEAGSKTIKVDANVDWKVGDQLFIATSTIQHDHADRRVITSIAAGVIELDKALDYYHFGAAESTGALYNGVDIRNEVALLTRNVKIMGEKKDGWCGHIMASDLLDNGVIREGSLILENVEMDYVSQKDVGKGGVRFENAIGSSNTYSRIKDSVIHDGLDWGLSIVSSNNIEIIDNTIVGWRAVGVKIDKTQNITFTGNLIGDVRARVWTALGMVVDKEACVALGSYTNKATINRDFTFKNNIAAGCVYAGFVLPANTACGASNEKFSGNVAHSSTRYGTYAYANPLSTTNSQCVQWGHYAAYKTQEACAISVMNTKQQKVTHMTCIDVQEGLSINNGG